MFIPEELIQRLNTLKLPAIIAISGVGGSGKSATAKYLGEKLSAPVISIDSFQKEGAFDTKYKLWEIMDFSRLKKEVLIPFVHNKKVITYGHFDPKTKTIDKREIRNEDKLVIEGVGLFRPQVIDYFNFKIWIDCPIEVAIERGKNRDREGGSQVDELWEGLWKDNDLQYLNIYSPEKTADYILINKS